VKACNCQTANCQTASFCSLGCLDSLAAVEASQTVAATGKKLMVVGVGSDLDDVTGVFGSMQIALPRACTHDADCPQSSCVAGACGNRLFLAHGDPDWQAPLMRLREALLRSARCNFWVEAGLSREQLIVALNGTPVPDADWGFGGKPEELVFSGQTCDGLLAHADWAPQVSYLPTVYEPL
jgi:hypothetical protein